MSQRAAERLSRKFEIEDENNWASVAESISFSPLRFLLLQLIELSNMAENPFTPDPLTTAFNSGKMSLAQDLFANLPPDLYPTLLKELRLGNKSRNDAIRDRLRDNRDDD